ncbi:MAG: endolytic transglycosylase MltG [candidate division KSB1 bacterium]|nr:endolytic transglycosylase MltG [candidate division KSB1 bacterium]
MGSRAVRIALAATLAVALGSAGWIAALCWLPGPRNAPEEGKPVFVRQGLSADSIAALLARRGVVRSPSQFLIVARLLGKTKELRSGMYRFRPGESCYGVVKKLANGRSELIKVTIPEGLRSWEIASLLRARLGIDSARFVSLVRADSFRARWRIPGPSLEGYLFPETYFFPWGLPEEEILGAMVHQCFAALDSSIRARADSLGLTVHQLLTLASLVEGEAKLDSERALIAAVYLNRLRRGMRLEACPTVQYVLGGPPRRLFEKDLRIDSPYNTYLYGGLPPGPVNNPGKKSILAVLHAAPVDYLFFVANGDGGHYFSRTLAEHIQKRRQLDRLRRHMAARNANRRN